MLRRNWFHILVALAAKDLHGSAIADEVLQRTAGELRLWPATLYRALDELAEEGFVQTLDDRERPEGQSRRKRYYRVTDAGRQAAAVEAARLEAMAREARLRLGGSA